MGRNERNLQETKDCIASKTAACITHVVDVSDEKGLSDIAAALGTWDILILNAGFLSSPASVVETSVDDWWQSFEVRPQYITLTFQPLRRCGPLEGLVASVLKIELTKYISIQTNVKGTMISVKAFLPTANPSHAAILGVTTGGTSMPPAMLPGLSAYISSKLAQVKLLEFVTAENPNVFVATVHPGIVDTAMFRKNGGQAEIMPMDTGWSTYFP